MLYIQQSLGPNEEVIHVGHFHWMYNVQAMMSIVWGIVASVMMIVGSIIMYKQIGRYPNNIDWLNAIRMLPPGIRAVSFLFFLFGLLRFAQMMVDRATTEIAITSNRLVYKRGLVARHVGEMSVNRVESMSVQQSFFGRIFDYGRVLIRGMGVGEVVLPVIADPITFRKAIEKAKTYGH